MPEIYFFSKSLWCNLQYLTSPQNENVLSKRTRKRYSWHFDNTNSRWCDSKFKITQWDFKYRKHTKKLHHECFNNSKIFSYHIMKGRRSRTGCVPMYLSMYVCLYPSSAHSFDPIVMKLGMDTWECHGVGSEHEARSPRERSDRRGR